jgi:hypothetical protein
MSKVSSKRKVGRPIIDKTGFYSTKVRMPQEWNKRREELKITWRHVVQAGFIQIENMLKQKLKEE